MEKGNSSKANSSSGKKDQKTINNDENEEEKNLSDKDELPGSMESATQITTSVKDDESTVEAIRKFMSEKLGFSLAKSDESKNKVLEEVSVAGIVKYINSGKCQNIIVLAGAGISTSAGIPDFRSPGSGLYDNLSKYKLPHPQAIFSKGYFVENPEPFYHLAKNLFPGSYKPTIAHYFVRLLHEKNLLMRLYTQNIDGLEKVAGIPADKVVEAHGTFYTSHCLSCKKKFSLDWMKDKIFTEDVPHCDNCKGLVKPDIVFFGENLPEKFFYLCREDFPKADLLIIMGSSLAVQPFASLVDRVQSSCPRLLLNREKAGHKGKLMSIFGIGGGLDLDSDKNYRDVAFLGDCDNLCKQLVDQLGWTEDFDEMLKKCTE